MKRIFNTLLGSFICSSAFNFCIEFSNAQTHHLEGLSINVCGDGAEWPPYIY
ncbi:MAG: hypothetical protein AB8G05_09710 [Oligoflexales bacterium]